MSIWAILRIAGYAIWNTERIYSESDVRILRSEHLDEVYSLTREISKAYRSREAEVANLKYRLGHDNANIQTRCDRLAKQNVELAKAFRTKISRKQRIMYLQDVEKENQVLRIEIKRLKEEPKGEVFLSEDRLKGPQS